MKLKLERPLAFFDLETTGTDVAKDRIVEICIIKAMPDGNREKYLERLNPTIPIPASSSAIHGIMDADVRHCPSFEYKAEEIFQFLEDCDLAGYNSNRFDIPLLIEEFLRVGDKYDLSDRKFVDVQNIFHRMEQRTLVAAYKFYCDKELVNAHSAEADVIATLEVLEAQLDHYDELENDVESLSEFSKGNRATLDFAGRIALDENEDAVFNFGKHKGKKVTDVFTAEPSYYHWMINAEFPKFTKQVITKIYRGMQKEVG
ncbi:MAG: 3'-5' exonuclease [Flavobacteriales bacterium]|nr:3'-5' exonuclease [Flavobacteriales bacterium]